MNSSTPEHLSTAKHLISTFFLKSEHELSHLTEKFPSDPEGYEVSNVTEVILFFFSIVKDGICIDLALDRLVHRPGQRTSLVASNPQKLIGPSQPSSTRNPHIDNIVSTHANPRSQAVSSVVNARGRMQVLAGCDLFVSVILDDRERHVPPPTPENYPRALKGCPPSRFLLAAF